MNFDHIWNRVKDINDQYSLSENELRFVVDHALTLQKDPTILELGVCHGRTLAALAIVARYKGGHAFGIDFFGLSGSSKAQTVDALEIRGVTNFTIIEGNTHDIPWSTPVGLLLVDAGHDEANVRPDIHKYVPKVKSGGYVFFDDYDNPYDPKSPHWAVRHYADLACADWEDLGIVDGMRGWRRP